MRILLEGQLGALATAAHVGVMDAVGGLEDRALARRDVHMARHAARLPRRGFGLGLLLAE